MISQKQRKIEGESVYFKLIIFLINSCLFKSCVNTTKANFIASTNQHIQQKYVQTKQSKKNTQKNAEIRKVLSQQPQIIPLDYITFFHMHVVFGQPHKIIIILIIIVTKIKHININIYFFFSRRSRCHQNKLALKV